MQLGRAHAKGEKKKEKLKVQTNASRQALTLVGLKKQIENIFLFDFRGNSLRRDCCLEKRENKKVNLIPCGHLDGVGCRPG